VDTLERLAYPIRYNVDSRGVSAARLLLKRTGACAGYVTIEIWDDTGAGGTPGAKIGTIGHLHAANITPGSRDPYVVYADAAFGYNLLEFMSRQAFLVLCAEEMTGAGNIAWCGTNGGGNHYYKCDNAGVWSQQHGDLCAVPWVGAPLTQIRGLVGSYGGGQSVEVELDDGQVYTGVLLDCEWDKTVEPFAFASPGAFDIPVSPAVAENVSLTLGITDELA
jgi:hypothetical protein